MSTLKKFYFLLVFMVMVTLVLFIDQIKKTIGIDIEPSSAPLISQEIYNIPISNAEVPRGNPGAAITVVEFLDLGCSDCMAKYFAINKIVDENPKDIRLFLKPADTAGIFSAKSTLANTAALCANKQGRYWLFLDNLMAKAKRNTETAIKDAAAAAKLNMDGFEQCLQKNQGREDLDSYSQTARNLNINVSPTLFINNKRVNFSNEVDPAEVLKKIIP